jgi:hypothetical protein
MSERRIDDALALAVQRSNGESPNCRDGELDATIITISEGHVAAAFCDERARNGALD